MSYTPQNQGPTEPARPESSIVVPTAQRTLLQRWLIPLLALVAALAVGLFGGIIIGQNTSPALTHRASFGAGFAGRPGNPAGRLATAGGFTTGTIVSVSGNTMVIKTKSGSQVTVTTDASTKVTRTTTTTLSTLKPGDKVSAIGKTDSNGTVIAKSISEGTVRGRLVPRKAVGSSPTPSG